MRWQGWRWRCWQDLFRRGHLEEDLDEEIRSHLAMEIRRRVDAGETEDEARTGALREIRSIAYVKEYTRDEWRWTRLANWVRDLRDACRSLLESPTRTFVAVVVLALGIGSSSAVLSVVDKTLLHPLPYPHADDMYEVRVAGPDGSYVLFDRQDYESWLAAAGPSLSLVTFTPEQRNLTGTGEPEYLVGSEVPATFFAFLGIRPDMGRVFSSEEDSTSGDAVVVLDHGIWLRKFGGMPSVIGQPIALGDETFTVIGVMPRGFVFPLTPGDFWTPLNRNPSDIGVTRPFRAFVRLAPDRDPQGAARELTRAIESSPDGTGREVHLIPLEEVIAGVSGRVPLLLMGSVIFVLLVAIANVASLVLVHASERDRETAVRLALGASRWRIVRQVLTESLILALAGGLFGLAWAAVLVRLIARFLPQDVLVFRDLGIDLQASLLIAALSVLAAFLVGMYPAAGVASESALQERIRSDARSRLGPLRGERVRHVLLIAEVAMAVILSIGALLLLRTLEAHLAVNVGIQPVNVVSLQIPENRPKQSGTAGASRYRTLIDRIEDLPGVASAAIGSNVPMAVRAAGIATAGVVPEHTSNPEGRHRVELWVVSAEYFELMGMSPSRGRIFDDSGVPEIVVSETTAESFWKGQDPIGKTFVWGRQGEAPTTFTVVGVVDDVSQTGYQARNPFGNEGLIYQPLFFDSDLLFSRFLFVRTRNDPDSVVQSIRDVVWSLDRLQPIANVDLMEDVVYQDLRKPRFHAYLLTAFAGLSLVIALVGIYGLMNHAVVQREWEMGVRLALGARPGSVVLLVVREAVVLIAVGATLGVFGALGLTRLLSGFLFGVESTHPQTFLTVAVGFLIVGLAAAGLPALRASRVDPVMVLRRE